LEGSSITGSGVRSTLPPDLNLPERKPTFLGFKA
jgi:hypothetical protein